MTRPLTHLALSLALTGCIFGSGGDDGDGLRDAPLSATGLVGDWEMFDFRLEFHDDGLVIDKQNQDLSARMHVKADSTYLQRVWIDVEPEETSGGITEVKVRGAGKAGRLTLTLAGQQGSGTCDFTVTGDTLTWVAVYSGPKLSFTETGRYARMPAVARIP